jgi:hypothetical protein
MWASSSLADVWQKDLMPDEKKTREMTPLKFGIVY